jgi:hypothetical protein
MKKSCLWSSGMSALDIAAIFTFETKINQSNCAFKLQIFHFERFTKSALLLSIISLRLKADFGCPIIFLIVVFVIKGQNLDEKYGIISCFSLSQVEAYSCSQKDFTTGFLIFEVLYFIKASSTKSLGTSIKVQPSSTSSIKVKHQFLK